MGSGRRCVFLDRDGLLNEDRDDYVKSWAEWRWVPGAREGAAALAKAGLPLVVVTNQACVGKGIVPRATLDDIHARMSRDLEAAGAPLAGLYVCPHVDADRCSCRKPKPGLLHAAARDLGLDLAGSTFVGDSLRDHGAALACGTSFLLVLTGQGKHWAAEAAAKGLPVRAFPGLREAAEEILKG